MLGACCLQSSSVALTAPNSQGGGPASFLQCGIFVRVYFAVKQNSMWRRALKSRWKQKQARCHCLLLLVLTMLVLSWEITQQDGYTFIESSECDWSQYDVFRCFSLVLLCAKLSMWSSSELRDFVIVVQYSVFPFCQQRVRIYVRVLFDCPQRFALRCLRNVWRVCYFVLQ